MAYDLSHVKILIVEDMQPMLALTISLLKAFGFKNLHGAKDAEEGFRLYCSINPDLVITDWLMEPYDGMELISRIRRHPASPNKFVPIILMSGYSDRARVEKARDKGVTEFLMKPYSAKDLYARIVQIVEKPRQFVDTGEFFGPDRRRKKDFEFYGKDKRGNSDKNAPADGEISAEIELILQTLQDDTKKT